MALIGKSELVYKTLENTEYDRKKGLTDNYDLIQEGSETYWITEVGTADEFDSFEAFMSYIKSQKVTYSDETLIYNNLELKYNGDFIVDGEVMDLDYKRFESDYATTDRKPEVITIEFNGQSLDLDYDNNLRQINN